MNDDLTSYCRQIYYCSTLYLQHFQEEDLLTLTDIKESLQVCTL